jgi:hypothetical protein
MEPRLPALPTPDLRRKFYGESTTDDIIRKLLFARDVARQNNEHASDAARQQFDAKAAPHNFSPHQLVLMDEHSFLNKNQKLAPKWSGPHRIIRLKGDANVEIQLKHNNRKTVVHANRLKPYFVASQNLPMCPDFLQQQRQPALQPLPDDVNPPLPEDYSPVQRTLLPDFRALDVHTPLFSAPPRAQNPVLTPRRQRISSSSSSRSSFSATSHTDDAPPAMRTRSRSRSSSPQLSTPAKSQLVFPQVTFQPLPVLQEGEGLEEEEIENDNAQSVTVNFVTGEDSWTLVQKRKKKRTNKNNKSEKWNAQQRRNFVRYGDIYQGEPYKNYRNVDIGPPLAIAQPQQQVAPQPAAQPQQLYPPIPLPYIPPQAPAQPAQAPAAAAQQQLPPPLIVVTPPPQPSPPVGRKRHRFEAFPTIQEEDEEDPREAHRPRPADVSPSLSASADSDNTDDFNTPPSSPRKAERGGGGRGEEISSALRRLAISADADSQQRENKILPDARGEGAAKVPGPPKLFQHGLAEAGPPSQRTRQMEKDLEKTLLKRYEEAKALEKKKKREQAIKKEQP